MAFLGQPHRRRDLAEALVGQAEHRAFGNVGMGVDRLLDLDAGDVLAAADDDVLLAVDDEQIAVLVEIAEVAGEEIAVGAHRRGRRFGIVPIAEEIADRADRDFAGLARAGAARRRPRASRARPAAGSPGRCCRLGEVVLVEIAAADRVGLGQAVAEQREGAREFVVQPPRRARPGARAPPAAKFTQLDRSNSRAGPDGSRSRGSSAARRGSR